MKIALGFKSHSGWAAMVAVARADGQFTIIDRRRIELVEDGEIWAKQPYHAAENLPLREATALVREGIVAAGKISKRRIREIVRWADKSGHKIIACGILVPEPMPEWTIAEILSVHFRMHKAEGILFPDSICQGAERSGIRVITIPEKRLAQQAEKILGGSFDGLRGQIADLGKLVGPPWGKDQKLATAAAMIAFQKSGAKKIF